MEKKKITKRAIFTALIDHINATAFATEEISNADFVEKLQHELELLDRKSTTEKKPTAAQIANEELMYNIRQEMEYNRLYSIIEMVKELKCCDNRYTTQKISALISKLVKAGLVERVEDKRKVYFKVISKD